jgi:hypothetical protein
MKKPEKLNKVCRRRNLCRAIELAWSSLFSHLDSSINAPKCKKIRVHSGDEYFNATCVQEYAEIILICATELRLLTKDTEKCSTDKTPSQ